MNERSCWNAQPWCLALWGRLTLTLSWTPDNLPSLTARFVRLAP